ncbi:MAG: A/G-specific adenine glycosylase [Pseudomonadota bacterium]
MADALAFAPRVVAWQATHGRHTLPWQKTRDPYRVWLSEIMLQQTQVSTVLGYYERFLKHFPDVRALAAATQDEVLGLWSGLGYYSRARNLHRCAQAVVELHGGEFPRSAAVLAELPGIGRSTAAAISSFCFGERVTILDGNVKRVLTRVLGFEGDLSLGAQEKSLWAQAQQLVELLSSEDMPAYTQGVMDLGATVCLSRQPSCLICPVQSLCVATREGAPERYPVKTRKLKRGQRENLWLWLQWRDQVWLVQRPDTGVWARLWSLPDVVDEGVLQQLVHGWPGTLARLPPFVHTLTHLNWTLHPVRWCMPSALTAEQVQQHLKTNGLDPAAGRWFSLEEALRSGLPAPLRKLLLEQSCPATEAEPASSAQDAFAP